MDPQEQKAIDQYVEKHPELFDLLVDVKALYAQLAGAGFVNADVPDDVVLAYFVARENMGLGLGKGPLAKEYYRLQEMVEHDPQVRTRYVAIKARMESIAAQTNPASHFEQLTGYNLDTIPVHASSMEEAGDWNQAETTHDAMARRRGDRKPARRTAIASSRQWIRPAMYACAAVFAGLVIFLNLNRNERLAYLYLDELEFEMPAHMRGINEEGIDLPVDSSIVVAMGQIEEQVNGQHTNYSHWARFRDATELMLAAQKERLHVYYSYDEDILQQAEEILDGLLAEEDLSERLDRHARFILARIDLALGNTSDAVNQLQSLAGTTDPLSRSAAILLDEIKN